MAYYDDEFEERRRKLLGLDKESKKVGPVGKKPSQQASFEQKRKKILEAKEAPLPAKEKPQVIEVEKKPSLKEKVKEKAGEVVGRAKKAVSDVKEYYGYKPKETIVETLKEIKIPKIEAPTVDREKVTNFLKSVVETLPPVVGVKIVKESVKDTKDFLSGITGAWKTRKSEDVLTGKRSEGFEPKNEAQKLGEISYYLMESITAMQAGGQSEVVKMGTQMFSGAIKASPLLSPKVAFVQDTLGKFTSKQFNRFLSRIKSFDITLEEAWEASRGPYGNATPKQIAKYKKVIEYSEQSGISMRDILAKSQKMKVKPSTKIYDFIKNSVESIKKILNSSLTKEEQKLLTAGGKSQLQQVIIKPGKYTPQQVVDTVVGSLSQNTNEGSILLKSAIEARETGQNIVIGKAGEIVTKPVEPPIVKKEVVKPPAKPPVEPEATIPKELEGLAEEARKYGSAEEFVKSQIKPTQPKEFRTYILETKDELVNAKLTSKPLGGDIGAKYKSYTFDVNGKTVKMNDPRVYDWVDKNLSQLTDFYTQATQAKSVAQAEVGGKIDVKGGIDDIYYHGSPHDDLKEISFGKGVRSRTALGTIEEVTSPSIFFTKDPETARFFAQNRVEYLSDLGKEAGKGTVYKRYLDLKNPVDLTDIKKADKILDDLGISVEREILGTVPQEGTGLPLKDIIDDKLIEKSDLWQLLDDPKIVSKLKKAGFDGGIVEETGGRGKSYAVFSKEQIKDVAQPPIGDIEQKVNWEIEKKKPFEFRTDCTAPGCGEDIEKMIDSSEDISYNDFVKVVGEDELSEMFTQYKWKPSDDTPLKLKDDYTVSFGRGVFRNEPAYYITHSATEYVFTTGEKLPIPKQPPISDKKPSPLLSPIEKPVSQQARKEPVKADKGVVKKVKIARKLLVKKKRLKLQEKVKNVIRADTQAKAIKAVEGFVDKSLLDKNNKELKAIRAEFNRQMFEVAGIETGNRKKDFAFLQLAKKDPQISEIIDTIEDQIVKIDTAIEFSIPSNKDKVFFLRRSPETDPVTSGIKPAQSPEGLMKRIEQLNKFAQSNAILRRTGKITDRRAVGRFIGKGKEGEIRLRAKFIANDSDYVEVLAHELSHAIEHQLTGGIDKNTYKVFGDKLDEKTIKTIEKELKAVTQELVGGEITKRNKAYYHKSSELLARFLQKKFVSPGNLSSIAPTANGLLEQQAIKHPMLREFFEAADNEIDKGVSKLKFLPDLRQTYQKHLGKRVGNIAFDEETTHRAMQERGKFVVEKFIKGKFKNIKDDSATLFRAAEAIKTTKSGKPEFGTRDFVTAKNKEEAKKLAKNGWEEIRIEMKDGKDLPVYARERYTPKEAEAIFESLSPEGKQLIKDFTAERKEAKDYFNRELIKDNNEIKGNIEGWVHHFFEDGRGPKPEGGLKFKKRQAVVRKKRTGKEGYVEDFKKSMTKVLTDLEGEKVFNDFINRQLPRVTKPIPEGQKPDPGWVEVVGELERGVGTQREKKVVIIQDGKSFVPKRDRLQMPKEIYGRYKLWKGLVEEASTAVKVVNNINRYWRINVLAHPGTATTNFISGGVQYSTKILTDFYKETLTGNLAYKKTRTNIAVMLKTLLPKGWNEADDWVYGSDLSNWYGQFTTKNAVPKKIDSYGNKALKLFGTYERYWKKVISLSEGAKGLKSLNKMTKEGLRLPTKAERQLIADINREVDLYAYDYANVPVWLEAHQRSVIGQTIKPFAKYPYKYAKHVTNLAGAAFDRSLPWQTRVSKLMALATVVALYAAYSKRRRDKQQTPLPTEKVPERLSTRGRLFVRTENGKEIFARVSKYPFINLSQAGLELVDGSWESSRDLISEMLGSIGPGGKAAALAFGYRHDYDRWKPVPALLGENLVSFVPGFRLLTDISRALDPYRRKQTTFLESFGSIVPTTNEDLQRKLHGEVRTFRVPIEGDIKRKAGESKSRTTTDRVLRNYWQDILVSMLSGIYQSRIDPKEVEAIIIREEKNRKEAEEKEIKESKKKTSQLFSRTRKASLIKQVHAAEENGKRLVGKERGRNLAIARRLREESPDWYSEQVGEKGETSIFGETIGEWPLKGIARNPKIEPIRKDKKYEPSISAIKKAGKEYDIPVGLLIDIAFSESTFDPSAKSDTTSATGLFQFTNDTWTDAKGHFGNKIDRNDPEDSAMAAAWFISRGYLDKWDDSKEKLWGEFYDDEELKAYYR